MVSLPMSGMSVNHKVVVLDSTDEAADNAFRSAASDRDVRECVAFRPH